MASQWDRTFKLSASADNNGGVLVKVLVLGNSNNYADGVPAGRSCLWISEGLPCATSSMASVSHELLTVVARFILHGVRTLNGSQNEAQGHNLAGAAIVTAAILLVVLL